MEAQACYSLGNTYTLLKVLHAFMSYIVVTHVTPKAMKKNLSYTKPKSTEYNMKGKSNVCYQLTTIENRLKSWVLLHLRMSTTEFSFIHHREFYLQSKN